MYLWEGGGGGDPMKTILNSVRKTGKCVYDAG